MSPSRGARSAAVSRPAAASTFVVCNQSEPTEQRDIIPPLPLRRMHARDERPRHFLDGPA
jgi:hypothetical protein